MERNTLIRAANELSLAAWFGGSLMGVRGLERGAAAANGQQHEIESRAWTAWKPIQTAAIVTQLAAGAALTVANRQRVLGQRGVATTSIVRTVLTGAAMASTMLAARTGSQVAREAQSNGEAPSETTDEQPV